MAASFCLAHAPLDTSDMSWFDSHRKHVRRIKEHVGAVVTAAKTSISGPFATPPGPPLSFHPYVVSSLAGPTLAAPWLPSSIAPTITGSSACSAYVFACTN